jgi:LmbE family N-acetylglucosaminyl deacetylase
MRSLALPPLRSLVVLGAHCDDIAIGAGGTLLAACRSRPGLDVHAMVLSGGGTAREAEERAALAAFCPGTAPKVTVLDLPDGRLPTHWERAKEELEGFRRAMPEEPDLVLAPSRHDDHQDHRGLALLAPTVFRDHLILGYEILKTDPDLAQPAVLVGLDTEVLAEKCRLLAEHYPSQTARAWFDDETFRGLARIRGVQAGTRYAEGFHPTRMLVDPLGPAAPAGT